MAVPATLAPRISRSLPKQKPADDESLLWKIGRPTLSGLAAAGNALDLFTGASSVRDVLAGENPLDQFASSPFSDENRVGGRELLERHGLLKKNTPGLDLGDVGGFAAEVALDPGSWIGGLGTLKSLGKGGSVLAKAGGDVANLSRVGRMTTTVRKAASKIAPEALQHAAERSGFSNTAEFLARHGDEPVGGLVALTKGPLGGPIKAFGTGKVAQKVGGALDQVAPALRYRKIPGTQFSPGQHLARVFSSDAMGLHTPEIAKRAADLPGQREAIITGTRGATARDVSDLARRGALDDEASSLGRAYGEGVPIEAKLTPESKAKLDAIKPIIDKERKWFANSYRDARSVGVHVERFADATGINYLPRQFINMLKNAAHTMSREEYLTIWRKGTEGVRQIIADPAIVKAKSAAEAEQYIEKTYGDVLATLSPPKVTATPGKVTLKPVAIQQGLKPQELQNVIKERGSKIGPQERIVESGSVDIAATANNSLERQQLVKELAHRIRKVYTPEQRAAGGFGRNVIQDIQDAKIGMSFTVARAKSMLNYLADTMKPVDEMTGDSRSVGEVLTAAGLELKTTVERAGDDVLGVVRQPKTAAGAAGGQVIETGALYAIAKAKGIAPTTENLDAIARLAVPVDQADDLVRLMKGDDIKNVVGPLQQIFDAATNLFKVNVLNWPARYSRDFTSSQAMNILTGNFDHRAFGELHKMVAGGAGDFTDIPIVQKMLAEQGLEATAENSTEMMRQLFYTYEQHTAIAGFHGTSEIVGELSGALPGTTKAFAAEFPGRDPISPLSPTTLNAGAPWLSWDAWKPWNVRGVGGRLTSGAKLPAMGERLGRYTDTMGRGTAFVTNLRRGVAPEQASRIADAIQVNYKPRSYTAAERKYPKRAFPFYSFVSRMLPEVTKQLLDRPGGGIAQSIRAANDLRGESTGPVPEYVGKGLAIPLGETDTGDQRYLTALDMMHETPLNVAQFKGGLPDLQGTLRNVLSQGNPYLKGIGELAFGKTLFQNRELEDADPTIGRLLTNVGLQDEAASGRAKPFVSTTVEQLAANSPVTRWFSTLRTATDPRKGIVEKAINLASGARITDVSPRVQRGILIDQLAALMKERGAQEMSTVRFRKAEIEAAEKRGDEDGADQMRMLNQEANRLLAVAKADAKQRKAKIKPPAR